MAFPISRKRLLLIDRRHNEADSNFYESSGPEASNALVWRNAINHMFSPRHPGEVCAEMVADPEAKGFL